MKEGDCVLAHPLAERASDFLGNPTGKNARQEVPLVLAGTDADHFFGMEEGDP
jgi:hypothetical protein